MQSQYGQPLRSQYSLTSDQVATRAEVTRQMKENSEYTRCARRRAPQRHPDYDRGPRVSFLSHPNILLCSAQPAHASIASTTCPCMNSSAQFYRLLSCARDLGELSLS